jgi:hypothetical protein
LEFGGKMSEVKMMKNRKESKIATVTAEKDSASFEANPFYERLLEMKRDNPNSFKKLSAVTQLAVEAYVRARRTLDGREQLVAA